MSRICRSFTLIEVLIAISLLVALSGAMFGFLFDMLSSRARALEFAQQQRAAATIIERLEGDLASCLVGDSRSGAGIRGDSTHLRVLTRGVATHLSERGADDPDVLGDLQFAEYRFDSSTRRIGARRGPAGRNQPAPPYSTLQGVIAKVRIRYHDGRSWRDSFDSLSANRLPVAIEMALWFNPWPNEATDEEAFEPGPATNPERESIDFGNFDEREFARLSDIEMFNEPVADRRRIFLIADAGHDATSDE